MTKEELLRKIAQHQERLRSMTPEERANYDDSQAVAVAKLQEVVRQQLQDWDRQQSAFTKSYNDMVLSWNLAGVQLFKDMVELEVEDGETALLRQLHDVLEDKKVEPPDWLLKAAYKSLKRRAASKRLGPPRTPCLELLQQYLLFQYAKAVYGDLSVEGINIVLADTQGLTVGGLEKKKQQAKKILAELPEVYSAQDTETALCVLLDVKLTDEQESLLANHPKKYVRKKRK